MSTRRRVISVFVLVLAGAMAVTFTGGGDSATRSCSEAPSGGAVVLYRIDLENEVIGILNRSRGEVDVSEWVISDGEGEYRIPRGVKLSSGSTFDVWKFTYNEEGDTAGLWLADEHDQVCVFTREGVAVDSYSW